MAVNGIYGSNGYNPYQYQNTLNMLRLASVKGTSGQAVSPVKRVSSVESSSGSYTDIQKFLNSYQSELAGLEETASKLSDSSSKNVFNDYQAASSDENVAVVKGNYKLRGDTDIALDVQSVAQAQQNASSAHYSQETVEPGADMEFQVAGAHGTASVSVSSTNDNGTAKTYNQMYQEAADAVNSRPDSGVKASVSNVNGKVSLVLTAKDTGEAKGFTVSGNTGAADGLDTALSEARDAVYTVTENGYSQTYQSDTNKVSLDYGRIDAELKGTGETNVYTGIDEDKVVSAVEDLVKSYNSVTKLLDENSSRGTGAAAHLSSFKRGMADAKTLKALGIAYDKDGDMQLDKEALKDALETDYEGTKSLIGGQFGIAEKASARADRALSDSVQRVVSNDLASAAEEEQDSGSSSVFQYFSSFSRSGPYNLSNFYTVGLLLNTMA